MHRGWRVFQGCPAVIEYLPGKIQVGPVTYTVKVGPITATDHDPDTLSGLAIHRDAEIQVVDNQAPAQARDTMLHEVLHCLFAVSGLFLPVDQAEEEEKFVSLLTPWLTMLLRDNPELVDYLTAG